MMTLKANLQCVLKRTVKNSKCQYVASEAINEYAIIKPARKQVNHKKCELTKCLCDDKNCQSDNNMCSDKNHVKSVCDDRNCHSTQWVHMQTAMKTSDMQSVLKTICNQIGTQPEIIRNI